MEAFEPEPTSSARRPRTVTVLGLLAGIAAIFSYLAAYAMANALVSAEMIPQWPRGEDPRPRWFLTSFCIFMLCFMGIGAAARFFSRRQLQTIDAMDQTDQA